VHEESGRQLTSAVLSRKIASSFFRQQAQPILSSADFSEDTIMPTDVPALLKLSSAQLDDLFSKAESGPIPDGQAKGTAIVAPGTTFSPEVAEAVSLFVWQGKTFDGPHGVLRNRITVLGLNAIVAEVYKGPSLLDGKECIVLDYSKTSLVAKWIRDEIRLIAPNLYLGRVYWSNKPVLHFALQFG
jgi:hypothetical protein